MGLEAEDRKVQGGKTGMLHQLLVVGVLCRGDAQAAVRVIWKDMVAMTTLSMTDTKSEPIRVIQTGIEMETGVGLRCMIEYLCMVERCEWCVCK